VQANLQDLVNIPEALPYFVTPKAVEEDSRVLRWLPHWAPCSITRALDFLTPAYKGHHRVMAYVLRVMETYPPERVTFFMPQLVQALRYDQGVSAQSPLSTKLSNIWIKKPQQIITDNTGWTHIHFANDQANFKEHVDSDLISTSC
jgi:hypothetical protein